jgi:beta-alanine--pyruvate transaminase
MDAFLKAYEKGMLIRVTGDIIAMSPPFIVEKSHIDQAVSILADVLKSID